MNTQAIARYVATIRNAEKRRYAGAYVAHLIDGQAEPDGAQFQLSAMARQSVRMQLHSMAR